MTSKTTTAIIDSFIAAFNSADVDRLTACFSPDAVIVRDHDGVTQKGLSAIRGRYRQPAGSRSSLKILNRIAIGDYVIDLASLTREDVGGSSSFVTMYRIQDQKIVRVDLIGAELAVWP